MVRSIFSLAAVLSVASVSLARDLVTPPVFIGAHSAVTCRLLNITSAPIPAQVQLIAEGGAVLVDSGAVTVNAAEATVVQQSNGVSNLVFCRFVKASKSKSRVELTVTPEAGDGSETLVVAAQ